MVDLAPALPCPVPAQPAGPPEGECVLSLDLAGCISNQEGPIRCVSQFLVHLLPARRAVLSLGLHPGAWTCPSSAGPYLEMSPQYHSASCREGALPPLARTGAAGFALEGFGGKARDRDTARIRPGSWPPRPQFEGLGAIGVTWGRSLLLFQMFLQQLLQQQHWEVGAGLGTGGRGRCSWGRADGHACGGHRAQGTRHSPISCHSHGGAPISAQDSAAPRGPTYPSDRAPPVGCTEAGTRAGGARSRSGPKAVARACTVGPRAGARRAARPRCRSRKRSVIARCSGSVGGSSTGPRGPRASANEVGR